MRLAKQFNRLYTYWGKVMPHDWREKRKKRNQMAKASRRRNWRKRK